MPNASSRVDDKKTLGETISEPRPVDASKQFQSRVLWTH